MKLGIDPDVTNFKSLRKYDGPAYIDNLTAMIVNCQSILGIKECTLYKATGSTFFLYHVEDEDLVAPSTAYDAKQMLLIGPLNFGM